MPAMTSARWSTSAGFLMGFVASGCATMASKRFVSSEVPNSGFAIMKPRLQACDELACYHSAIRHFYVRKIRCPEDITQPVVCEYERAETDSPFPELSMEAKQRLGMVGPGDVQAALQWHVARSRMHRSESGLWWIIADASE